MHRVPTRCLSDGVRVATKHLERLAEAVIKQQNLPRTQKFPERVVPLCLDLGTAESGGLEEKQQPRDDKPIFGKCRALRRVKGERHSVRYNDRIVGLYPSTKT